MSSGTVLLMGKERKENDTDTGKYDKIVWPYIVWIYRSWKIFFASQQYLEKYRYKNAQVLNGVVYPKDVI